jgi:hypothetical protein
MIQETSSCRGVAWRDGVLPERNRQIRASGEMSYKFGARQLTIPTKVMVVSSQELNIQCALSTFYRLPSTMMIWYPNWVFTNGDVIGLSTVDGVSANAAS